LALIEIEFVKSS